MYHLRTNLHVYSLYVLYSVYQCFCYKRSHISTRLYCMYTMYIQNVHCTLQRSSLTFVRWPNASLKHQSNFPCVAAGPDSLVLIWSDPYTHEVWTDGKTSRLATFKRQATMYTVTGPAGWYTCRNWKGQGQNLHHLTCSNITAIIIIHCTSPLHESSFRNIHR